MKELPNSFGHFTYNEDSNKWNLVVRVVVVNNRKGNYPPTNQEIEEMTHRLKDTILMMAEQILEEKI